MGLITIDQSKCKKDGVCVRECPFSLIRLSAASGFPEMVPDGEVVCTSCGHCTTVCPHAALDHERVALHLTSPIEEDISIGEARQYSFSGHAAPSVFSKTDLLKKRK